jgi:thiamine monophosphate synthase
VLTILSPLYVICDAEACDRVGWTLVDFAAACIDGGATFLQVRAKGASGAWLLDATAGHRPPERSSS